MCALNHDTALSSSQVVPTSSPPVTAVTGVTSRGAHGSKSSVGDAPTARVRVIVVDDSKDFLASAVQLLSTYPEVEVVAAAFTAREAIDQVEVLQPDVVLIDLVMPEMDGLEATRELKASYGLKVIIWTLYGDARYHVAAAGAGADGFLSKSHIGKWLRPLLRYIYEL